MKTIFGVHLLGKGDEARMSDIVGDINQEKFVREANKIRIPIEPYFLMGKWNGQGNEEYHSFY